MGASSPTELTAEMVAAFVANNPLPKSQPPALVHAVHATVTRLAGEPNSAPPQIEPKAPSAPIRRSLTPDFDLSRRPQTIQVDAASPGGAGHNAAPIPREMEPAG